MSQEQINFLRLEVRREVTVTREADPDDRWDADDTSSDWDILGISLAKKDSCYALPSDFPVEVGDTVFCVYAVYSTGNSFHRDDGDCLEVISFHKNEKLAHKNRDALSVYRKTHDFVIEFDSGARTPPRRMPWDGYFESLDFVAIAAFKVRQG